MKLSGPHASLGKTISGIIPMSRDPQVLPIHPRNYRIPRPRNGLSQEKSYPEMKHLNTPKTLTPQHIWGVRRKRIQIKELALPVSKELANPPTATTENRPPQTTDVLRIATKPLNPQSTAHPRVAVKPNSFHHTLPAGIPTRMQWVPINLLKVDQCSSTKWYA